MSPSLFRRVAVAEAITWAGLLLGMVLKYVTETTELGVQVFGMVHGVVFIAYVLVTLAVAVDQQWSRGRTLLGLVCAIPPFFTLWFERYAVRHGSARRPLATVGSTADRPDRARRRLAGPPPRPRRGRRSAGCRCAHRRRAAGRPTRQAEATVPGLGSALALAQSARQRSAR